MRMICFDDGPTELTEGILDHLGKAAVKATFAVVGILALDRPQTVKRIVAEGHTIANHTMTHARLTDLSRDSVLKELMMCAGVIEAQVGFMPKIIRPPYTACNWIVEDVAKSMGCTLLRESSMGDYLYDDVDELVRASASYQVFLGLHDNHSPTAAALPAILAAAA
jgi:peptidoglycan/xylan/chitin deacetylase (PgdA/CDA1 family)